MLMSTSFSQQSACNLYSSTFGNVFLHNINRVVRGQSIGPNNPIYEDDEAQRLKAVEDSLTSMLDNVLLAYSSAQLMLGNDTILKPTTVLIPSIRIGGSAYIYIIAVINFAYLTLYLIELARTRGWKALQRFDYMDIKTLIVGTSMGGTSIANATRQAHELKQTRWNGTSGDRIAGKIDVYLDDRDGNLALVYARKNNGQSSESSEFEMLEHAEEASANDDVSSSKRMSSASPPVF